MVKTVRLPVRYRLVECAHAGRRGAGRGRRRYQRRVPYARAPGVRRRRRDRGGRQRELQGQSHRVVERIRVQHAGLLVRHNTGAGHRRRGADDAAAAVGGYDPNGRTPLAG